MITAMKGYTSLKSLPQEQITDKITRRMLVGEKGMIVVWNMKAGVHADAHQHPHEQLFCVVSGKMDFRLGDERRLCGPGDMGVIPGGVEHEAWFPEDAEVWDIFAPVREDFLTQTPPAYMRKG